MHASSWPRARLKELGLELSEAPEPGGIYNTVLLVRPHPPHFRPGTARVGRPVLLRTYMDTYERLGADLDIERGKRAARQPGLTILSTIKTHFGDLNRLARLVKLRARSTRHPISLDHPRARTLAVSSCRISSGSTTVSACAVPWTWPCRGADNLSEVFRHALRL